MKATLVAILSAVLVQPFAWGLIFVLPSIAEGAPFYLATFWTQCIFVILFALIHIMVLGVPAFLILKRRGSANGRSLALTGVLAGSMPIGIFSWPLKHTYESYSSSGNWHGKYVTFFENGVPTLYGWMNYFEGVMLFGFCGGFSAVVFWFTWRRVTGSNLQLNSAASGAGQP